MKKIIRFTTLCIAFAALLQTAFAQTAQRFENINCINVNNVLCKVYDLQVLNTNTGNGMQYNVSFNIFINQGTTFKETLAAIIEIDNNLQKNTLLLNKYVRVDQDNDPTKINEQWTYKNIVVDEILLPALDASTTRQTAVLKIKFHTNQASALYNIPNDVKLNSFVNKETASLTSFFGFKLDDLPVKLISKLSSINLCKAVPKNFTVTLSARDITLWNEAMMANPTRLLKAGRIIFYAPNLRDELFVIKIYDVKITSSVNINAATNQIQRYEVGLLADRISTVTK